MTTTNTNQDQLICDARNSYMTHDHMSITHATKTHINQHPLRMTMARKIWRTIHMTHITNDLRDP